MLRAGALLLAFIAMPMSAQQPDSTPRPSLEPLPTRHIHPTLDRSAHLTVRTTVGGLLLGTAVAYLEPTSHPGTGALVGVGLGLMAGAIGGAVLKFNAPSPRPRLETTLLSRYRDWARYVGYGAQYGIGVGMIVAIERGAGHRDNLFTALDQLMILGYSFLSGMVAGAVTYFFQH